MERGNFVNTRSNFCRFYLIALTNHASNHVHSSLLKTSNENNFPPFFSRIFIEVSSAQSRPQPIDTNVRHSGFVGYFVESNWRYYTRPYRWSSFPVLCQFSSVIHDHWHSIAVCQVTGEGHLSNAISKYPNDIFSVRMFFPERKKKSEKQTNA